jgi:hypothetical protein
MRKLLEPLTVLTALNIFTLPVYAEVGSDVPSDAQLLTERGQEAGSAGSGIFDIAAPPSRNDVATRGAYSARQIRRRRPVPATASGPPRVDIPGRDARRAPKGPRLLIRRHRPTAGSSAPRL